ncbi:Mss4-like protein [Hypoxylon sp. FL0543]|nr:Mss4-like protein [Hypoxylon sp. FL0543]
MTTPGQSLRSDSSTTPEGDSLRPAAPRLHYAEPVANRFPPPRSEVINHRDVNPWMIYEQPHREPLTNGHSPSPGVVPAQRPNTREWLTNGHPPPDTPYPQPEPWIRHESNIPGPPTDRTNSPERPLRTGSCSCGAIRLSIYDFPRDRYLCHCDRCKKAYGTAFGSFASYHPADVAVTGAFAAIIFRDDWVWRHFCGRCGSVFKTEDR